MTKRNPIIADFKNHIATLIHEHDSIESREAATWEDLLQVALESSGPLSKAATFGFDAQSIDELVEAREYLATLNNETVKELVEFTIDYDEYDETTGVTCVAIQVGELIFYGHGNGTDAAMDAALMDYCEAAKIDFDTAEFEAIA